MKERPIIFSGEMMRAILERRKTQTRRVVNPALWKLLGEIQAHNGYPAWQCLDFDVKCPYDGVEQLWVKETWAVSLFLDAVETGETILYRASWNTGRIYPVRWKPSIYMPRWASRLTLEIKNIRVERVQDISTEDCILEGIEKPDCPSANECFGDGHFGLGAYSDPLSNACGGKPWGECFCVRDLFKDLWNSINEKRGYGWDNNPWVWVIEFKLLEASE